METRSIPKPEDVLDKILHITDPVLATFAFAALTAPGIHGYLVGCWIEHARHNPDNNALKAAVSLEHATMMMHHLGRVAGLPEDAIAQTMDVMKLSRVEALVALLKISDPT
jgi:hypothetical protein